MTRTLITHRRITMVLHWSMVFVILAMMKGSAADDRFRIAFVIIGGLWCASLVLGGLRARAGPKLSDRIKRLYRPTHYILHGLMANLLALLDIASDQFAWIGLLITFMAGMFHALFQMWRHTALYDGALRLIVPKIWHKHL